MAHQKYTKNKGDLHAATKKHNQDYVIGTNKTQALKGIDLKFRDNEFVTILGPSGCGKTTMLNLLGGLDIYTTGDLVINGKSTKDFTDRDWDTYRNRRVGFVFQNYNLISHQSVLRNVELALTLSGVSKSERLKRAVEVLGKVGLADQLYKKPNQLSGGQMQRVAIARALINNPEILLADEPTGALDSETSVQIMELIKEIAKERLVIMVTHNPELAEKYSNRTIKLFDGELIGDSNPFDGETIITGGSAAAGKTSMSFLTALSLSFNNLLTKKTRTFLTAFAGSIGIIGIALILSLSSGAQTYIERVQEDTLSQFPIIIESTTADFVGIMTAMHELQHNRVDRSDVAAVYSMNIMSGILSAMAEGREDNDLRAFRHHIEANRYQLEEHANAITYTYNINFNIFDPDTTDGVHQINPSTLFGGGGMGGGPMGGMMMGGGMNVWTEMIDNPELLEAQFEVIAGHWPQEKHEIVLVVDEHNEVTDFVLYTLRMMDPRDIPRMMQALNQGETFTTEISRFTYEELLAATFKMVLSTDMYALEDGIWVDNSDDEDFMRDVIANSLELQIVGIIRPAPDVLMTAIPSNIGYLQSLTEYIIQRTNAADIVVQQRADEYTNVFTGLAFDEDSRDTFERNMSTLGAVDIEIPSSIRLYPRDFDAKEAIEEFIADYNRMVVEAGYENTIHYTDFVGMMMASVSTIINVISNVLIAFVGISLVVSSIMIGIITYVSVLERTKEIGILKSIGASKKDISRVFNAETLIVGFTAGSLGVLITVLLTIPANMIIYRVTEVSGVAALPILGAVVLILLSMGLTLIAGLIPSKIAARKDPVVALRTE